MYEVIVRQRAKRAGQAVTGQWRDIPLAAAGELDRKPRRRERRDDFRQAQPVGVKAAPPGEPGLLPQSLGQPHIVQRTAQVVFEVDLVGGAGARLHQPVQFADRGVEFLARHMFSLVPVTTWR